MSTKNAADLVYVDEKSVKALQNLAKTINAQATKRPSPITKRLNAALREAADPMRADIAASARGIQFKKATTRSSSSRSKRDGKMLKRGFKAGKGLRTQLADAPKVKIDNSAYSAGVRIRMASRNKDVNAIGKAINFDGFVRHPTRKANSEGKQFAAENREVWANTETTNGKNWFYRGAAPRMKDTSRRVAKVLDDWTRDIAREIERG